MEERFVSITVGNNIKRETVLVPSSQTLRQTFENADIDYTVGMATLDGVTLAVGDLDKTFDDCGIIEKAFLLNVAKMDNA